MMQRDQMMVMEYRMQNGVMMGKAEDGNLRPMTVDVILSDGIKVMKDGVIVKTDSSTIFLKDGEGITRNGELMLHPMKGNTMPEKEKGSYQDYDPSKLALAEKGKVVLFFHAPWCPSCKAVNENILQSIVPEGLSILKVDYDSSGELKKKYGVTSQHTFVQVDKDGNLLKKWVGGSGLKDIVSKVQ
jgi:thiol-disulfide isomerase/thioredoxin